jgi:hypothetical protein
MTIQQRDHRHSVGLVKLQADLERRRSNVAVPIPQAKHKTPRAMLRQQLREDYR